MKLKKLIPPLVDNIIRLGLDKQAKEIQTLGIPKIKSGCDLFLISPEKSGKSTALLIGLIQQLKEPFEEAPRAIVIVSDKAKAFEMEEQFQLLSKGTKLRSFVAFDEGIFQYQKDEIYDGLDVLFVTPKRLTELVNINGIPLTQIKMLVVDDINELFRSSYHAILHRLADGLKNPQIILAASVWNPKLDELEERVMKNPMIIKAEIETNQ